MASLSDFYNQLVQRKAQQSFYRPAAQAILSSPWASENASPLANFGASIAQGLLGGYLTNEARNEEKTYTTDLANVLNGALSGKTVFRPSVGEDDMGLISAFKLQRALDQSDAIDKLKQQLAFEDLKDERASDRDLKQTVIKGLFDADNPRKKRQVESVARQLGYLPDLPEGEIDSSTEGILAPELLTPTIKDDNGGPDLGLPTLRELEDQRVKQLAGEDYYNPEVRRSAMVSARAESDDRRKRSRELYQKPLQDQIKQSEDLGMELGLLDEGINKAGTTGSSLASTYERGLNLLDSIIPGEMFPEAAKQVEGDTALRKAKVSETLKEGMNLKGSFSDPDREFLMSQAPGEDKTPAENKAIRSRLATAKSHLDDRNSFFNYVLDTTGGNFDKANQYWKLYSDANPLFDKKGNVIEERIPWQQFDFKGAYDNFLKGKSSKSLEDDLAGKSLSAAGPSLPSIGSRYNGETVISVRKIR